MKRFVIFMYALSMVVALTTVDHANGQSLYQFAWSESLVNVAIVAILLWFLPSKGRINLRNVACFVFYLVAYPLALVDTYCFAKFETAINPSILMLAGETDSREAGEFLTTYLTPDVLASGVGLVLGVLALHILSVVVERRWKVCERLTERIKPAFEPLSKPLKALISTRLPWLNKRFVKPAICLSLIIVVLWPLYLKSKPNYEQLHTLMTKPNIGGVEHYLTQRDHGNQYYTPYRVAFSIYANHLASKQIATIRTVLDEAKVDSCSATSPHIVMIIGEAYCRAHSQLYGYEHPTTPRQVALEKSGNLVKFDDVVSPWNLTSYVFKHIMSTYVVGDEGDWCDYPLIGSLFRKSGYHVTFLTNEFNLQAKQAVYDFSGGFFLNDKELSDAQFDTRNPELHLFDAGLLEDYDSMVGKSIPSPSQLEEKGGRELTIFHLMGQHVRYKIRCPARQMVFSPADYPEREDMNDAQKLNMSQYDNATHYNDSIVSEIVRRYEGTNTIVLYMPDHGEEVHPKEAPHFFGRLHSAKINQRLAREEFTIPFWIYATPEYQASHPEIWNAVKEAHSQRYMTDALPHLLMYLAGIHCQYYREELNILSPKYNAERPRIIKHQVDYDEVMGRK